MADNDVSVKWEKIGALKPGGNPSVSRARVPGGYLILQGMQSICFYPNPGWDQAQQNKAMKGEDPVLFGSDGKTISAAPPPKPNAAQQMLQQKMAKQGQPKQTQPQPQPMGEADSLPDVDPVTRTVKGPQSVEEDESGIVEDLDDSFYGPDEAHPQPTPKPQQQSIASADTKPQQPQQSGAVLVQRENLEALKMALVEMGEWVFDNYEHHNNKPRKLWKVVMMAAGSVIPEEMG